MSLSQLAVHSLPPGYATVARKRIAAACAVHRRRLRRASPPPCAVHRRRLRRASPPPCAAHRRRPARRAWPAHGILLSFLIY